MIRQILYARRSDVEKDQAGDWYRGSHRYYDHNLEMTVVKLFSGDCYVTPAPREMLVTILGSCVAACVRDPQAKVGGMNHFLLPGTTLAEDSEITSDSLRYGAFAMEQLVNEVIKAGGRRANLEVKVFGGGNVIESSALIGDKNARFVKEFIRREGLTLRAEHLGGPYPRRVHYFPETGTAHMRLLRRKEDLKVADREKVFATTVSRAPVEGAIELF